MENSPADRGSMHTISMSVMPRLALSGNEGRVLAHGTLDLEKLLELDHRPHGRQLLPGEDLFGVEADGHSRHANGRGAEDVDAGFAGYCVTWLEGANRCLVRFKLDGFEARRGAIWRIAADDVDDLADL